MERYSVSNSKFEADKKSERSQKSSENVAKNCKSDLKAKTEKSVETLEGSQNAKQLKEVNKEATVDSLEAVIHDKLATHKNTIPKELGIDPQLVFKFV